MLNLTTTPNTIDTIAQILRTHQPILIHGAPGIGKTQLIAQKVADKLKARLRPFIASHHDPVAIHGLPLPDAASRTTKNLINEFFYETIEAANAGEPQLIFFDELTNSSPAHYGALMDAVQERKVANRPLPDNVYILAAGNRLEDGSIVQPMPSPMRNRFIHIAVEPDLTQFTSYLLQHPELPPSVAQPIASFLQANPDYLTPTQKQLTDRTRMAFPSPRSWFACARVATALSTAQNTKAETSTNLSPDIAQQAATCSVGADIAAEFAAHVELDAGLPSMCAVAAGRSPRFEPSSPAAHYALAVRLSNLMADIVSPETSGKPRRLGCECYETFDGQTPPDTDTLLKNVVDYAVTALQPDMQLLAFKQAFAMEVKLKTYQPVIDWYLGNIELFKDA